MVERADSEISNFFSMIADPVRFSILKILLKSEELPVSTIVEKTGRSQTMVSYHLRCLKDCGLLNNRKSDKDGRSIFYSINDPDFVDRFFLIASN